jgi:hypothetical protein
MSTSPQQSHVPDNNLRVLADMGITIALLEFGGVADVLTWRTYRSTS